MAGVFISYRRADSAGWAGRLKDHLEMRFGAALVWHDVDDIPAGAHWLERIRSAVTQADAILVVIGPRWLELGGERMQDPEDVLRQEVSIALASKAPVVPVLVGGADMPVRIDLPVPLRALALRQAVTLLDADWQRSVQLLIEALREAVDRSADRVPLHELHERMYALQAEFFDLLRTDAHAGLALAGRALALLDRQLPHYPQDGFLQLFRGYFDKNQALALRVLGDAAGAAAAVARAERVFQVMRSELEGQLAGAYNGMGSTATLRERYTEAISWIDRALALVPDYPEALHDRERLLRYLDQQRDGSPDASAPVTSRPRRL